jgi:YesN/AraC family two-component response regulator
VKVLVVDDHETVRKGVCAILTTYLQPEICEEAANGQEAIEKALVLQPDIVILDINMPVLGGFAAAQGTSTPHAECPNFISDDAWR